MGKVSLLMPPKMRMHTIEEIIVGRLDTHFELVRKAGKKRWRRHLLIGCTLAGTVPPGHIALRRRLSHKSLGCCQCLAPRASRW